MTTSHWKEFHRHPALMTPLLGYRDGRHFFMLVGSSISVLCNVKMKLLLPFLGLDPGITWSSKQMIKYVLLGACLGF